MTGKTKIDIAISVKCAEWPEMSNDLNTACANALKEAGFSVDNAELSIVLSDNPFIQKLNKDYRGQDQPTNVLAFAQNEDENEHHQNKHLGDIILSYDRIKSEALEQNKSFHDHAMHLTVHGALHLIGYDHETKEEAKEMEALEILILNKLGIKNPYEIIDSVR